MTEHVDRMNQAAAAVEEAAHALAELARKLGRVAGELQWCAEIAERDALERWRAAGR